MSVFDPTESGPKPKTAAERIEAKRLTQLLCYKLLGLMALTTREDNIRIKMWSDMMNHITMMPMLREIPGDAQGNEEKTNEYSRLSNAFYNLSSAVRQGFSLSSMGTLPESLIMLCNDCERYLYIVPLYHKDIYDRLSGILDLAKELPTTVSKNVQVPPSSASLASPAKASRQCITGQGITSKGITGQGIITSKGITGQGITS